MQRLSAAGPWFAEWPARLPGLADLILCPGAGAGPSVFRDWPGRLPPYVSVLGAHLPGRETRSDAPFATDLGAVAEALAGAYRAARPVPRPVVLFGHSMGGALAVALARALDRPVAGLMLAASAPGQGKGGGAPDHETVARLVAAYDSDPGMLADPRLFDALAPIIAADIAMLRAHRPRRAAADAVVLAGAGDAIVPPKATADWARFLTGARLETLPGGHFFALRESQSAVLARLGTMLETAALTR